MKNLTTNPNAMEENQLPNRPGILPKNTFVPFSKAAVSDIKKGNLGIYKNSKEEILDEQTMAQTLEQRTNRFLEEIKNPLQYNKLEDLKKKKIKYQKFIVLRYNYLKQFKGYMDSPTHSEHGDIIMDELEFANDFLRIWDQFTDSNIAPVDFCLLLREKVYGFRPFCTLEYD